MHDASAAERRKCHPTPRAAPILTPAHRPRRPSWRWLPSCRLASGVGRQGKVRRGSNRMERHGSARLQCRGTCVGLPCQALRPAVSTCLLVATAARSCMSVRCGGRSVGGIRRLFVFVWLCWRLRRRGEGRSKGATSHGRRWRRGPSVRHARDRPVRPLRRCAVAPVRRQADRGRVQLHLRTAPEADAALRLRRRGCGGVRGVRGHGVGVGVHHGHRRQPGTCAHSHAGFPC